jgi:hypothetical protein
MRRPSFPDVHCTSQDAPLRAVPESILRIVGGPYFEGRCVRSGPATDLVFAEDDLQTDEIISTCDRLAAMSPELGSGRLAEADLLIRGQSMMIELMAGAAAEEILFPRERNLGARHDQIEARAFAKVVVAAAPAAKALLQYTYAEAKALIRGNRDIVDMLVEALIEAGTLTGDQVDEIISAAIAIRLAENERVVRDDWRRRQRNATEFLEGIR